MSSKIVLFDLPSKDPCKCWSYNPWKTRLLLNYKGIPYETRWTEYPDIKPLLEKHIPPNKEGAEYTIPTVLLPDGTYMQDSREIAQRIARDYPNPPLTIISQTLLDLEEVSPKVLLPIRPVFIPKMPQRLLNEASWEHWYRTREERFGMPLDQVEREQGGDSAWEEATPGIREVTKMLTANAGPFFEGEQLTYVDFVWAGFLRFMQRIGDDMIGNVLKVSGNPEPHLALLKACEPWLARDDH